MFNISADIIAKPTATVAPTEAIESPIAKLTATVALTKAIESTIAKPTATVAPTVAKPTDANSEEEKAMSLDQLLDQGYEKDFIPNRVLELLA